MPIDFIKLIVSQIALFLKDHEALRYGPQIIFWFWMPFSI